jgi:hypothetical protein
VNCGFCAPANSDADLNGRQQLRGPVAYGSAGSASHKAAEHQADSDWPEAPVLFAQGDQASPEEQWSHG